MLEVEKNVTKLCDGIDEFRYNLLRQSQGERIHCIFEIMHFILKSKNKSQIEFDDIIEEMTTNICSIVEMSYVNGFRKGEQNNERN